MNSRNLVTGLIALVLIAISSTFIVDEREVVIKFRLGEIVTTYNEPGLYFMIPFLNNVKKYDSRLLTMDSKPEQFLTSEKKNVIVDLYLNVDQSLEKIDESQTTIEEIEHRFSRMIHRVFAGPGYYNVVGGNRTINRDKKDIYTIADYRRDFNDKYCDKVDVLMWGRLWALKSVREA